MNFVLSALKIFQHRTSGIPNDVLSLLLRNTCIQADRTFSSQWESAFGSFKRNSYTGKNKNISAHPYEYGVVGKNIFNPPHVDDSARSLTMGELFNEGDFRVACTSTIGASDSKHQTPNSESGPLYSRVVAATGDAHANNVADLVDIATMSPVQDVPLTVRVWFPISSHVLNAGVICLAPTSFIAYNNSPNIDASAFLLWTGNAIYLVFCSHADTLLTQIHALNNASRPPGYTIGYCMYPVKQDALWIDYSKISERLYPRWVNSTNSSQLETVAKLQRMITTQSLSYTKIHKPELQNYFLMMESQRNAI